MAFKVEKEGDLNLVFNGTVEKAELATKAIAMELFKNVILKTPVDTGRARGNWTASIGSPVSDVKQHTDKGGESTISQVIEKVDDIKLGDTIYLSNNLPYIGKLEYGSSKQAPEGMVRISMQEIKNDMKDILKDG